MAAKTRHSSGPVIVADIVFPCIILSYPVGVFPCIILSYPVGVLRYMTNNKVTHESAVKLVYSKLYHDTVYCINFRAMERTFWELWKDFREGRRQVQGCCRVQRVG